MIDAFTGIEVSFFCHALTLSYSQMEEATWSAALFQEYLLGVFIGFSPKDAAEIELAATIRRVTRPGDGIS